MKEHVIIPIFIPHLGCNNQCVFCNQKKITARETQPSPEDLSLTIDEYLGYFAEKEYFKEIGFFGGSFTGIDPKIQQSYLAIAKSYKERGLIDEIRLSTRPDYIDLQTLSLLKEMSVNTIELGIQSFYDDVLFTSKRGHTSKQSISACNLIKEFGFNLGIQLMIGLPQDTTSKSIESAKIAATYNPKYARLYPTLVLDDTQLFNMYQSGLYVPFSQDDMINTTKEMYKILEASGAYILRVGLKSTTNINVDADKTSGYHPAFRQIVEGEIAKEVMEEKLGRILKDSDPMPLHIEFSSSVKSFSNLVGHKSINKKYFKENYPYVKITYTINKSLENGHYGCFANDYEIERKEK